MPVKKLSCQTCTLNGKPMRAINIFQTSATCENRSRHELLAWVNDTLKSNFNKIDELCTGAAYCQLIDILFPGSISLKRVKFHPHLEYEFVQNFKLLQMAFDRIHCDHIIPVDRLIKGRFHDNLGFLQWFQLFFEANDKKRPYDPIAARDGASMGYGMETTPTSPRKTQTKVSPHDMTRQGKRILEAGESSEVDSLASVTLRVPPAPYQFRRKPPLSAGTKTNRAVILKELDNVQTVMKEMTDAIGHLKPERDFFYRKLRRLETLCQDEKIRRPENPMVPKILKILYTIENGFNQSSPTNSECTTTEGDDGDDVDCEEAGHEHASVDEVETDKGEETEGADESDTAKDAGEDAEDKYDQGEGEADDGDDEDNGDDEDDGDDDDGDATESVDGEATENAESADNDSVE